MVNRVNVRKVANAIEAASVKGLGFNMEPLMSDRGLYPDVSGRGCGTVACIAGWALVVERGAKRAPSTTTIERINEGGAFVVEKFLGLTDAQSVPLFLGHGINLPRRDITPSQAVSCLRHLARTGKVDWARATKSA